MREAKKKEESLMKNRTSDLRIPRTDALLWANNIKYITCI